MKGPLKPSWSTEALHMPSLAFQDCRYGRTSVLGLLATGMPISALPMLATPSPWYGRTIATPGNSQAWLCPALFLKQQVALSFLHPQTLLSR